jgi:hypothetical protein
MSGVGETALVEARRPKKRYVRRAAHPRGVKTPGLSGIASTQGGESTNGSGRSTMLPVKSARNETQT